MKTWSLEVTAFETFHVQQPYSRTHTTFNLKSHNFKLLLKLLFHHITDNIPNAAQALLIRFSTSISVPAPAAIILPRSTKRSTASIWTPATLIILLMLPVRLNNFVLPPLIFKLADTASFNNKSYLEDRTSYEKEGICRLHNPDVEENGSSFILVLCFVRT